MSDTLQDTPQPPTQPSLNLQYPQILLQAPFESLLELPYETTSSMTGSTTGGRVEVDTLSESWASLDNFDYSAEDDLQSETTDAGSLISGTSPEDVDIIDDEGASSDLDEPEDDLSSNVSKDEAVSDVPKESQSLSQTMTLGHARSLASKESEIDPIDFEEPDPWPDALDVEVKLTYKFDEAEAHKISQTYLGDNSNQLDCSIRMIMNKRRLQSQGPFRLLYSGNSEARQDILAKMGDILLASAQSELGERTLDSSRYHVVPGEFGPGSSPNYSDLVPIHTQIVVDDLAHATSDHDKNIVIGFKNGSHCTSRNIATHQAGDPAPWQNTHFVIGGKPSMYEIAPSSKWTAPDLAIFYSCEDDSSDMRQKMRIACKFMRRHGIPVLTISERGSWLPIIQTLPLSPRDLHFYIESRGSVPEQGQITKRYPVDLKTFKNLNSEQLNRHLASLIMANNAYRIDLSTRRPLQPVKADVEKKLTRDVEKNMSNSILISKRKEMTFMNNPGFQKVMVLILFTILASLCYTIIRVGMMATVSYFTGPHLKTLPSPTSSICCATSVTPICTISTETKSPITLAKSFSTPHSHRDISSWLSKPAAEMVNKSESDAFQVQVIGDCHMVVKAPTKLTLKKKMPVFEVIVSRGSELLNNSISKLFDGVYTVKIDREEAYGLLNMTLTVPKMGITEVHQVDFGRPWLRVSGWVEGVQAASARFREDMSTAQAAFTSAFERFRGSVNLKADFFQPEDMDRFHVMVKRATSQAEAFSKQGQERLQKTTDRIRKMSIDLRRVGGQQQEIISRRMMEEAATAQQMLGKLSVVLGSRFENLQQVASENLAKAQERAHRAMNRGSKKSRGHSKKLAKESWPMDTSGRRCRRTGKKYKK